MNGSAPRTVAAARRQRAIAARLLVQGGFRRLMQWLRHHLEQLALARQYRREMDILRHADDRMLSDVGLTRGEAQAAAAGGSWFRAGALATAAVARREDAIAAAHQRRAAAATALPRIPANNNTEIRRVRGVRPGR